MMRTDGIMNTLAQRLDVYLRKKLIEETEVHVLLLGRLLLLNLLGRRGRSVAAASRWCACMVDTVDARQYRRPEIGDSWRATKCFNQKNPECPGRGWGTYRRRHRRRRHRRSGRRRASRRLP
jgi:hypothetical protein